MQFNISPEVKVIHPTKEQVESGEVILSDVNDVGFKRTDDAVLPNVVKKVFNERKHYKDLMKKAKKEGDLELATLYDNRQGVKKIIINSMYGVCLAPGFHLFDIDCARAITRSARVTLRDWLKMYVDKYYPSKLFIKDLVNEYSTVTVELSDGTKKIYNFNDKITVERGGKQIIIQAKDFNKETDLLGIDDEYKV
jgi:DNA polymerase elongation subunit (family B)